MLFLSTIPLPLSFPRFLLYLQMQTSCFTARRQGTRPRSRRPTNTARWASSTVEVSKKCALCGSLTLDCKNDSFFCVLVIYYCHHKHSVRVISPEDMLLCNWIYCCVKFWCASVFVVIITSLIVLFYFVVERRQGSSTVRRIDPMWISPTTPETAWMWVVCCVVLCWVFVILSFSGFPSRPCMLPLSVVPNKFSFSLCDWLIITHILKLTPPVGFESQEFARHDQMLVRGHFVW